jgi:hypothetical protein
MRQIPIFSSLAVVPVILQPIIEQVGAESEDLLVHFVHRDIVGFGSLLVEVDGLITLVQGRELLRGSLDLDEIEAVVQQDLTFLLFSLKMIEAVVPLAAGFHPLLLSQSLQLLLLEMKIGRFRITVSGVILMDLLVNHAEFIEEKLVDLVLVQLIELRKLDVLEHLLYLVCDLNGDLG